MDKKAEQKKQKKISGFSKGILVIITVAISLLFIFLFYTKGTDNPAETTPAESVSKGKELVSKHCQSCHMLPDPGLLDKDNWKKLLPEMGVSLGIQSAEVKIPEEDRGLYPTHPAMANEEWQSILNYYQAGAPASLPLQNKPSTPRDGSSFFAALLPPETLFKTDTRVTCVRIDNSVKPGRLFVYDASSHVLLLFNKRGLLDSVYLPDVVVDIRFYNNQIFACSIGNSLTIGTSTNKFGKVFPIVVSSSGKLEIKPALIENLARPVQITPTDMNSDGRTDFILCEFGSLRGSLSWLENVGKGKYKKNVIRDMPGSVNVHIKNQQTKQNELWVLFAQGEEGIFHFTKKADGTFEVKQVLRFPPTYGSTSFELADVNNDGFQDIVYSCGDNGDITTILKPYHGIYVFENDGKNNFGQRFFYPMHGCYRVMTGHFNKNGQIDLAAIAYFTDQSQPETFVYLKNEGNFRFTPYAPPAEINFQSVLTMDAGDFDEDGRQDIIIGNALTSPNKTMMSSPFAILANLAGD